MSVLKANQKPSPFEVEHYAYKIRTVITDLALRKFGLKEYVEKPKPETYSKWSQQQKDGYDKSVAKNKERYEAFIEWFIPDEQKSILNLCRNMIHEIFLANEIYPQHLCECDERRLHQDLAIGYCENLIQELQYVITTLHVNIEKYETITKMIVHEQQLIKGWRKSDNKVRKKILEKELTGQLTESKLRKSYNLLKELWVTIITPDLSTSLFCFIRATSTCLCTVLSLQLLASWCEECD